MSEDESLKTAVGSEELGSASARATRSDALRNRERLVAAAREAFTEEGTSVSMESIARRAGVGIGTLYRHFPTRLSVVEAVYVNDVDEMLETARRTVDQYEPWEAVSRFFDAFDRYAQTKVALLAELQQAFEKNPAMRSGAREKIFEAFDIVIGRAQAAGVIRADVTGSDVSQLLSPVCTNTALDRSQIRRMLDIILEGLRASTTAAR